MRALPGWELMSLPPAELVEALDCAGLVNLVASHGAFLPSVAVPICWYPFGARKMADALGEQVHRLGRV